MPLYPLFVNFDAKYFLNGSKRDKRLFKKTLKVSMFSRFYTYFIIQYSSRLLSRAGPDIAKF
jgi:hypothetical protein